LEFCGPIRAKTLVSLSYVNLRFLSINPISHHPISEMASRFWSVWGGDCVGAR